MACTKLPTVSRAALRPVRARVLCPMRASYRPITAHKNFPHPPTAGPKNCGPGCCSTPSTPLNAALTVSDRRLPILFPLLLPSHTLLFCCCMSCVRLLTFTISPLFCVVCGVTFNNRLIVKMQSLARTGSQLQTAESVPDILSMAFQHLHTPIQHCTWVSIVYERH